MTHEELGRKLIKYYKDYEQKDFSDVPPEYLASQWLHKYPDYADLVSPIESGMNRLIKSDRTSTAWTESGRIENRKKIIENDLAEAKALHEMHMLARASAAGIPVAVWSHFFEMDHAQDLLIALERARRDTGLDGADRVALKPHQLMRLLRAEHDTLVDELEKEKHPRKREVLEMMIADKKEELRARGQQAVVQAGGRSRLGQPDEDANKSGSSDEGSKATVEPVPP